MFKEGLLKGKRILVTGGGTGLGKEMATHYASLGADIVICGRRLNVLEETADEIKSNHNKIRRNKSFVSLPPESSWWWNSL